MPIPAIDPAALHPLYPHRGVQPRCEEARSKPTTNPSGPRFGPARSWVLALGACCSFALLFLDARSEQGGRRLGLLELGDEPARRLLVDAERGAELARQREARLAAALVRAEEDLRAAAGALGEDPRRRQLHRSGSETRSLYGTLPFLTHLGEDPRLGHYIALHYIPFHCIALHCIAWHITLHSHPPRRGSTPLRAQSARRRRPSATQPVGPYKSCEQEREREREREREKEKEEKREERSRQVTFTPGRPGVRNSTAHATGNCQ